MQTNMHNYVDIHSQIGLRTNIYSHRHTQTNTSLQILIKKNVQSQKVSSIFLIWGAKPRHNMAYMYGQANHTGRQNQRNIYT